MKQLLYLAAFLGMHMHLLGQNAVRIQITDEEGSSLPSATVRLYPSMLMHTADSLGRIVITNLDSGFYRIQVSHVGRLSVVMSVNVRVPMDTSFVISLQKDEDEEGEVIVTSTRTSTSIRDAPTRVETISGEELAEKANMMPGDIRMTLAETTGIQTQQTSATSYSSSIRIQGLDGRYTQLLRDGLPLYSGFSGGLSIMQISPLDLRQVEVIKGSSSTLYGGGAIAGIVNLVSKTPGEKRVLNVLTNATTAGGVDLSGFYAEKFRRAGITVFASRNSNTAYDPGDIGMTAIPKFLRYTINPRFFLYGKNTTAEVGAAFMSERRMGGSMEYIRHRTNGYFETNDTRRFTAQLAVEHRLSDAMTVHLKNSYSTLDRTTAIPGYRFDGVQLSSYSELSANIRKNRFEWTTGFNVLTDHFRERAILPRDYHNNTFGWFVQQTWTASKRFSLESGIRTDYVSDFGFELLPRLSAMCRVTQKMTLRLGGGMGYKTPTIFNEDAERIQFRNIQPIDRDNNVNERSVGGNFDMNYRTHVGSLAVTLNQLFFYTKLDHALVLEPTSGGMLILKNADGYIDTRGLETNVRLALNRFKLAIGYTLSDVRRNFDGIKTALPLTPRHRLNNILMYEAEGKLKLGLEAYYFGRQELNDGSIGRSYWITGLMAEKIWRQFSVFINFENIFDTRQTRFGKIFTGTIENPVFQDIYAPVDGFVMNGGIKWTL